MLSTYFIWVPGHQIISKNPDEYAVLRPTLNEAIARNDVLSPLDVVTNKIDNCALCGHLTIKWLYNIKDAFAS